MKKISMFLSLVLIATLLTISVSAKAPVTVCNVTEKSATIDGVVSDSEWNDATRLTINISDTSTWTENGAGIVGTEGYKTLNHTDADFSNDLAFMVEGDYLYLLLTRTDTTLNFATDNFRTPYASDCSLMWFYNSETDTMSGLQLLASNKSGTPIIGYFPTDAEQSTSTDITATGDATAVTKTTANSYVMEAKIKLSAINLTLDNFKSNKMTVTYCCVNICEAGWDSDDGQHALWGTSNYQAQYAGVNNWTVAPAIKVVAATAAAPVTEAATTATPDAAALVTTPAAAQTGDAIPAAVVLLALAAVAVVVAKKTK